jgi:hypothetical protein
MRTLALTTEASRRKWPSNPPSPPLGPSLYDEVTGDTPTHGSGRLCGPGRWHGLKQTHCGCRGCVLCSIGNRHSAGLNAHYEDSRNFSAAPNVYLPAEWVSSAGWSNCVGGTARSPNHGTT